MFQRNDFYLKWVVSRNCSKKNSFEMHTRVDKFFPGIETLKRLETPLEIILKVMLGPQIHSIFDPDIDSLSCFVLFKA